MMILAGKFSSWAGVVWRLAMMRYLLKVLFMLATTAPTDLTFCAVLGKVSYLQNRKLAKYKSRAIAYPMTIVSFSEILTAQGSSPILEFIWMATFLATD